MALIWKVHYIKMRDNCRDKTDEKDEFAVRVNHESASPRRKKWINGYQWYMIHYWVLFEIFDLEISRQGHLKRVKKVKKMQREQWPQKKCKIPDNQPSIGDGDEQRTLPERTGSLADLVPETARRNCLNTIFAVKDRTTSPRKDADIILNQ